MKRYGVVFVLLTEKRLTDGGGNSTAARLGVGEAGVVGGEAERWRRLSSVSSDERHAGGGFGSPEPEAAVAVICGDGVAGELEWSRGRLGEDVWEDSGYGASPMEGLELLL
jgi:hypothetical protein